MNDRQADARTDGFPRQLRFRSVEELKDLLQLALWDAGAEITHAESDPGISGQSGSNLDFLCDRVFREFDGVIDQVDDDLSEAIVVDFDDLSFCLLVLLEHQFKPGTLDLIRNF
jgi:hypothetical protein